MGKQMHSIIVCIIALSAVTLASAKTITATLKSNLQFSSQQNMVLTTITYADTTYLPMRHVGAMFNVNMDPNGQTIDMYSDNSPKELEICTGPDTTIKANLRSDLRYTYNGIQVMGGVRAIQYQNTTYLPLRDFCRALGVEPYYADGKIDFGGYATALFVSNYPKEVNTYVDGKQVLKDLRNNDFDFRERSKYYRMQTLHRITWHYSGVVGVDLTKPPKEKALNQLDPNVTVIIDQGTERQDGEVISPNR